MSGSNTTNFRGSSTNLNPRYLFSLFVPTITINEYGQTINVLEVFSTKMIKAIKAIRPTALQHYTGQPITTLTYRRYHNTTCYWMILLASKQLHPLTIDNGDLLVLPDIDAIRKSPTLKLTTGARIPVFTTI